MLNSSRTVLQHIDTHSSGVMTRLECLGFGRNTYRDVNIRRRQNPPYPFRLLASNSDGFHSFSVEHGPVLEHCELSFIADDFFNAHNRSGWILIAIEKLLSTHVLISHILPLPQ